MIAFASTLCPWKPVEMLGLRFRISDLLVAVSDCSAVIAATLVLMLLICGP